MKLLYRAALFVSAIMLSALPVAASQTCPVAPSTTMAMTPTLNEDFSKQTTLNAAVWTASAGNPYGNPGVEAETYSPTQDTLTGSALRLSTVPAPAGAPKPYLSGGVSTLGKFSQLYGHFEATIKMPHQNGQWPAFWMIPTDGSWPPELDIVEFIAYPNGVAPTSATTPPYFGENPATTVHWLDSAGKHQQATVGVNYGSTPIKVFEPYSQTPHTYAIDWRPGLLEWIQDGMVVFCSTDPAAVPNKPMYLILNNAVSNGTPAAPGWPGYVPAGATWPQNVDISSVRASQFPDLLPTPTPAQACVKVSVPVCGTLQ